MYLRHIIGTVVFFLFACLSLFYFQLDNSIQSDDKILISRGIDLCLKTYGVTTCELIYLRSLGLISLGLSAACLFGGRSEYTKMKKRFYRDTVLAPLPPHEAKMNKDREN